VIVGALLLIIPGLIVLARWSLLAPLVVLERAGVREASTRSTALVEGRTGIVLACVVSVFVLTDWFPWALHFGHVGFGTATFLTFAWSTLTAPFAAHALTVVYYRLADPGRPVIDPVVLTWKSVWEGR
jgi:hypothetical protein